MTPDFLIKLGVGVAVISGIVLILVAVFAMWKREIKSNMEEIKKSKNTIENEPEL